MVGNGNQLTMDAFGKSSIPASPKSLLLYNILYVPQITKNLVSISQFTKNIMMFCGISSQCLLSKGQPQQNKSDEENVGKRVVPT